MRTEIHQIHSGPYKIMYSTDPTGLATFSILSESGHFKLNYMWGLGNNIAQSDFSANWLFDYVTGDYIRLKVLPVKDCELIKEIAEYRTNESAIRSVSELRDI